MNTVRKPYPSDISDEEWSLIIPYLLPMKEGVEQRHHDLRELFNGLRYVIRYGIAWRAMPNDLPPWTAFTSNPGAGWMRDVSRLLCTIFGLYCVLRRAGKRSRRRRSSTAGHCVRPRKARYGQGMMARKEKRIEAAHGGRYSEASSGPARQSSRQTRMTRQKSIRWQKPFSRQQRTA